MSAHTAPRTSHSLTILNSCSAVFYAHPKAASQFLINVFLPKKVFIANKALFLIVLPSCFLTYKGGE